MFDVCWSVKGGSGTSVVAVALALLLTRSEPDPAVTLIDFGGDAAAVVGAGEPASEGITDWFASTAAARDLHQRAVEVAPGLALIPRGYAPIPEPDDPRWEDLAEHLAGHPGSVVIDAGPLRPPPATFTDRGRSILVIRPCYLALRRVATMLARPDQVVLVDEPGRALHRRDVEAVLARRVDAHLELDPAVARAVDAGLLAGRLPAVLSSGLRRVA